MAEKPARHWVHLPPDLARRRNERRHRRRVQRLNYQRRFGVGYHSRSIPALRDCPAPPNDIPWTGRIPLLWEFLAETAPDWNVILDALGVESLEGFLAVWVPSVASSPAFFAVSSLIIEAVAVQRHPEQLLSGNRLEWIKDCAVNIINQNLQGTRCVLSDDTVLCVATLIYYEWFCGSFQAAHSLHSGLSLIIGLRDRAPMRDWRRLACFSYTIGYLAGPAPSLPPLEQGMAYTRRVDNAMRVGLRSRHPTLVGRHHTHLAMVLGLWYPSQRLISIAQHVLDLAAMPVGWPYERAVALDFSRRIEEDLLACRMPGGAAPAGATGDADAHAMVGLQLYGCTWLALLAVLHTYTQAMLGGLPARAEHAIMSLGMRPLWALVEEEPRLMLWALFVAAPWTGGFIRQGWIELINRACSRLQMRGGWAQVREELSRVVYIPTLHDHACFELWVECVRARQARAVTGAFAGKDFWAVVDDHGSRTLE